MMTTSLWIVLALQTLMGAFDTLYHHELTERLAWRIKQQRELCLHAARNGVYALIFISFALFEPYGLWALSLLLALTVELVITLYDFIEEDGSRSLPPSERVVHSLMAINFGVILALLVPLLWPRIAAASVLSFTWHGAWSIAALVASVLLCIFALRDTFAAARLRRLVRIPAGRLINSVWPRQSILVTGGTGFIGRRLVKALLAHGHEVTVLSRQADRLAATRPYRMVASVEQIEDSARINAIVNLAGEPIASGLWTRTKRQRIMVSRQHTTRELIGLIARLERKPEVLVNASAVGWYGIRGDETLTEADTATPCFSHEVCQAWEAAAQTASAHGVRVVCLRIGIVLGREGGMLAQLLPSFDLGLGARLGKGGNWVSWIERDDLVRLIIHCIATPSLHGAVNATAPNPTTHNEFCRELARALGRPLLLRAPAWVLRLVAGDLARELLLGGQRVLPTKALASGFDFHHRHLDETLRVLLGSRHRAEQRAESVQDAC